MLVLNRIRQLAMIVVMTLSVLLCYACVAGAGEVARPVVLIDQYHMNSLSLNPRAEWRMTTLKDELVAGGYTVRELWGPITNTALSDAAVFVIMTPYVDYDSQELTALNDFVNSGRGVLFGANYGSYGGFPTDWSHVCQMIAQSLGFNLDNNLASDAYHSQYNYLYWIIMGQSCLGSGPLTGGVQSLQCFGSTTLTGPVGSVVVAHTDNDAVPAQRPIVVADATRSGKVVVTGNLLYFADPVPNRNIGTGYVTMDGILAAQNRRFAYNIVTWLAGSKGRPLVEIQSPASNGIVYGTVDVKGTVCDATLSSYRLECFPQTNPSNVMQIGPVHSSSVVRNLLGSWDTTGLPEGRYTLKVTAENAAGNTYSQAVAVDVKQVREPGRLGITRSYSDGNLVHIEGKEVTAGTDDITGRLFIEEEDRSAGMAVLTDSLVARGSRVSVTGVLSTLDGVLTVTPLSITSQSGPGSTIKAVGVTNQAGGSGLSTAGLLVKVWGKVIASDATGFIIDDGSCSTSVKVLASLCKNSVQAPAADSIVAVTGISLLINGTPTLLVRDGADVKIIK